MNILPSRFFVTGTDTDIGKTFVSALLMLGLKSNYWKPIQSGIKDGTDTNWIRSITGLPEEHFFKEQYSLNEPLSPHAAAALDGVQIDMSNFQLPGSINSPLIVEGAGGLMVPINKEHLMIDLIQQLALPVVLVCRSGLGTINHTLLSLQALRRNNLQVSGVIMNGPKNISNKEAIEEYGNIKVVAQIEPIKNVSRESLIEEFEKQFGVKV